MKLLLMQICALLLCYSLITSCICQEQMNYEHRKTDIPRVRIKVFRGPNQKENGEEYASWGYWVKQPSSK